MTDWGEYIWFGFRRESGNEVWSAHHWCAPISIWGDIAPKSEKIAEKRQYIFKSFYFAICSFQN